MKLKTLLEAKTAEFQIKMNGSWKDAKFPVKDLDDLAYALSDKPSHKLVDQSWFFDWFKKEFVGPSKDIQLEWNDIDIIKHEDDECLYFVNFTNVENGDFTANPMVYKLVDAVVTIMYGINMAKLANSR